MNTLSRFYYSFYLYNILKEPIPFEIQCRILNNQQKQSLNQTNCSSLTFIDNEQLTLIKNEKKDSNSYIVFRSFPIDVMRQLPSNLIEQDRTHITSNYFFL
jgi:hypothetical protein